MAAIHLTVRVPEETDAELRRLAAENGVTRSDIVRLLVHRAIGANLGSLQSTTLPADGHVLIVWTAEAQPAAECPA